MITLIDKEIRVVQTHAKNTRIVLSIAELVMLMIIIQWSTCGVASFLLLEIIFSCERPTKICLCDETLQANKERNIEQRTSCLPLQCGTSEIRLKPFHKWEKHLYQSLHNLNMTRVALRNLMIVLNVNFIDSGFLRLCDGTSELVARSSAELRQTDFGYTSPVSSFWRKTVSVCSRKMKMKKLL